MPIFVDDHGLSHIPRRGSHNATMGIFSRRAAPVHNETPTESSREATLHPVPLDRLPLSIDAFIADTTTRVMHSLRTRVEECKDPLRAHELPLDRRFALLETILPSEEQLERAPGRSSIERIVRGYLGEFLRQTLNDIESCNIVSGKVDRSAIKAYWDTRSSTALWGAAGAGVYHSAFAYNSLRESLHSEALGEKFGRKAAWGALIEIVRHSVKGFKESCPEVLPGVPPRASIYNDHEKIVRYSVMLERHRLNFARAS
jgi:hypothetical protein